ncbi:hypothetical protein O0550_06615 [Brevibacillus halotolerans]|uniref:hypothetical protein n=1 Tax=Brevibacillus TaxID=55080 RepID=UPI00215C1086|nr:MULTISPECIES: hypothetical protein [Brevibacillus]MCR8962888.1 hypothetical protein [Brevibacillus laterosporus]MCZ0835043.1 hypothetical protein [Brevibacillus halotolerans]
MGKVVSAASVIPLDEMEEAWYGLIEFNSFKAIFVFLDANIFEKGSFLLWELSFLTCQKIIMSIIFDIGNCGNIQKKEEMELLAIYRGNGLSIIKWDEG